ncbi:MAG: response regulator transcription factor [Bacteroidetes bacterium]|nr:response regulator transcription factor [Bacteroidota bacterium]
MKALIIEDEKPAAKRLSQLLTQHEPDVEILAVVDSIEDSIIWVQQHPTPDVIFMDIHLADGNSFEIFKRVSIQAPIIFTTAYDEYAINAFKVNSVDYLLKPIKKEELVQALSKLNTLFVKPTSTNISSLINQHEKKYQDRFIIKLGNKLISLETATIAYFFSKDKMTYICDQQAKHYPIDVSLDKIELMLDPKNFFRINRQILANHLSMHEIVTTPKSRLQISLSPPPPSSIEPQISSERSAIFKKWLHK